MQEALETAADISLDKFGIVGIFFTILGQLVLQEIRRWRGRDDSKKLTEEVVASIKAQTAIQADQLKIMEGVKEAIDVVKTNSVLMEDRYGRKSDFVKEIAKEVKGELSE